MIVIEIKHEFSNEDIASLLADALETSSKYWMQLGARDKRKKPVNFLNTKAGEEHFTHISFPMNEGGEITIIEHDDDKEVEHKLNLAKIRRGLKRMARSEKYAFRFQNIVKGDYDATDSDCFLQFCVLGEVIYG